MSSAASSATQAPSDEQQQRAAETSAFLDAMQKSHEQLQNQRQYQNGHHHGGDDATSQRSPPRKAQRRASTTAAKESQAVTGHHGTSSDAPPPGPPYICPICQTSYSRLEYLRRHERRHQDIRPFVCECGKGFSRSDVLSRHKRQCHFHLTGEQPLPEAALAAAKKTRKLFASKGNKSSSSKRPAESNGSPDKEAKSSRSRQRAEHSPVSASSRLMTEPGTHAAATQPGPPPPLLPHAPSAPGPMLLPPPPPFYSQASGAASVHDSGASDYSRSNGLISAISHALSSFGQSHSNYPPSPESSASINSRNSSPRLHYRDAIPYTQRSGSSSGSRHSSLRKGTFDPHHPPASWDLIQDATTRSSPAPGSRLGSVFGSSGSKPADGSGVPVNSSYAASSTAVPAFSYPANEFANLASSGSTLIYNQTLVSSSDTSSTQQAQNSASRGADAARFTLSTGPLSPFSGVALNSISPYLSAFSNARDTPLVASPGRSIAPGTPTSSLSTNVFDYTMRPPVKPASTTTPDKPSRGAAAGDKTAASSSQGSNPILAAVPALAGIKRKEAPSATRDEPTTPSASLAILTSESGTLPALTDFIDDQQRSAANGLLTLLGGGGAETPSRFVRGEGVNGEPSEGPLGGSSANSRGQENEKKDDEKGADSQSSSALSNNPPRTTSANPSSNPFFESVVTPGPEAFLLRLQGGERERRAGLLGADAANSISNHIASIREAGAMGPPSSALGASGLDTLGFGALDFGQNGLNIGVTPGVSSSVGWLLSPSIQALISQSALGGTPKSQGEGASHFPLPRRPSHVGPGTPILSKQRSFANGLVGGWGNDVWQSQDFIQTTPQAALIGSASSTVFTSVAHTAKAGAEESHLSNLVLEKALSDRKNPFFIPKQLFRACYSIPHWDLPPLARLSVLAMHAQQNLLKHVPILHEPTFRIDTTPGCLAFASCMLGCHEVGRRWWAGEEVVPLRKEGIPPSKDSAGSPAKEEKPAMGPVRAEETSGGTAVTLLDEKDGQPLVKPIVMTEKVDMLMRSFAGKHKSEKDRVSAVQALMLFQANNFLSSDPTIRAIASISHGSVISVARKAGLYDPDSKHVSQTIQYTPDQVVRNFVDEDLEPCFGYSFLPSYIPECPDGEKLWRQWADYEGRRRTAHLIFLMDIVASLDAGLPTLVELGELKHLPLPVPDTIWRASSAAEFKVALEKYRGITLDEALQELLGTTSDADRPEKVMGIDGASEMDIDGTQPPSRANSRIDSTASLLMGRHGPFARLIMILPVLQGILHLLQSRVDSAVSKVSPLEPWLVEPENGAASPGAYATSLKDTQVEPFKLALNRWRRAWDADDLCLEASSPAAQAQVEAPSKQRASTAVANEGDVTPAAGAAPSAARNQSNESATPSDRPRTFTSKTASGATPLCEDALPFYWLSHVLLGHATSKSVPVRRSPTAPIGSADEPWPHQCESSAGATEQPSPVYPNGPRSSALRRIPDFRSMLRFAKAFVNSVEGNSSISITGKTATSSKNEHRTGLSLSLSTPTTTTVS